MRLSQWSPGFNPNNQKQTHSQVWLRILDLPLEYWRPKILFEIAGGTGTPLSLDEATKNKVFEHYARILVDLDLSCNLPNEILVERNDYASMYRLFMKKCPFFCDYCKLIGHNMEKCKRKTMENREVANHAHPPQQSLVVYVPKQLAVHSVANKDQENLSQVLSSGGSDDHGAGKIVAAGDQAPGKDGAAVVHIVDNPVIDLS